MRWVIRVVSIVVRPLLHRPQRAALVIRRHRVHRIPPHVRDDREPPLSSGGMVLHVD
jgi:hypothetical protein